ncbi:ubiquitin carboxyl-terminal hydrolase Usp2 isoform X8 [Hermetia illucens]|uniref:ubiquitin carboxyl-terminal hydrolase Usp2 isoform X8 n=1 Tax=Hermetia illucens TaxID=343691 RepID=UPI0018CC5D69|nr:ubiquitin carboxyl-terminal hydrolase Usp2 isoform X8 [Hermetia illucens]
MPVISPTRYSTTVSSSSYLPPSIGGTTSSLAKSSNYGSPSSYHTSSYRSNSLGSSGYSSGGYSSSYLRASYRSNLSSSPSIYRTSSYLTGGNNDTTATSRFGVRNASIRSALPASPTPSRYYDREGRSSALAAGRSYDTEDPSTSKSSLNSSNSYDRTAAEGLCGLRNIGNTCYMNSVIQCLSHTRELTKFLKSQVGIKSSSKDQQILLEFAKLIREMWSPNVRSVTPLELKSAFSSKHRMYSGYNQQDAQEFLRFFLDSLHCALNAGVKGEQLKIDDSLSDNKKADLTWEWYCKVENSVIRDLFVGQLKSTLKCTTCGNTSVTFDPFWDLSVSLPSSSRCKLDACLDLFIREEILDGDEMPTCSKCQARRKCTKSFTIQRFPKYLAIHLKRFSETRWSKLSNVVEFPTGERELNMAPYASNTNVSATYSLYGIANHMGSTAGGHYVALCKHPVTKKWHEFNDNVVSDDLSESVLVSSSAYLLFYERAH